MDKTKITIYLLSTPRIEINGREIFQEISSKGAGLIFYLCMNSKKKFFKNILAEIFWPESSAEKSSSNLRQVLFNIKKVLEKNGVLSPMIISEKGKCFINEEFELWVDVKEFYKNIDNGIKNSDAALLKEASDLYEQGFFEGFFIKGSAVLDEWIMFEREHISRLLQDGIYMAAEIYEKQGEIEKGENLLKKLLKINNLTEETHLKLMELYLKNNERHKAVQQYNICAEILRKELNISPSQKLKETYEKIVNIKNREQIFQEILPQKSLAKEIKFFNNYIFEEETETIKTFLKKQKDEYIFLHTGNHIFQMLEGEGIYNLLEKIVFIKEYHYKNSKEELAVLFPELSNSQKMKEESSEIKIFYVIRKFLEKAAEKKNIIAVFRNFIELDEKSRKLFYYLFQNVKNEKLVITGTYKKSREVEKIISTIESRIGEELLWKKKD